jgi:hypothetical protein
MHVTYLNLTFSRGSPQKILWWRRSPGGPASGSIRCPPVQVGGRSAREHVIGWMRVVKPRDCWNNFTSPPPLPEGHMIGEITGVGPIVIGASWDDHPRDWVTILYDVEPHYWSKDCPHATMIWGKIAVLRPRQDSLKIDLGWMEDWTDFRLISARESW